jgi:hypothetical protein
MEVQVIKGSKWNKNEILGESSNQQFKEQRKLGCKHICSLHLPALST